jgi:hypothetical protein
MRKIAINPKKRILLNRVAIRHPTGKRPKALCSGAEIDAGDVLRGEWGAPNGSQ